MVNHDYVYILDRDFGPLFTKFCSYFPYPTKLCLNEHEWLKRQLTQRAIPFEPLDNGVHSSAEALHTRRVVDRMKKSRNEKLTRAGGMRMRVEISAELCAGR